MILTLTPNPALDVTYDLPRLRPGDEHRVQRVHRAPGGKGVNVARVLTQLGEEATCAGPLGGATGDALRDLLTRDSPVRQSWTPIAAETRRTLTVLDEHGATGLNEPGPALTDTEVTALLTQVGELLSATSDPGVEALTINGSLPPGLGTQHLGALLLTAQQRGCPVLVDSSGPALLAAAEAGADILKPNAAEARTATGEDTPEAAAISLLERGARTVVCSLGSAGMLALTRAEGPLQGWRARLPRALDGNPTGAGDAVVAVLAAEVLRGKGDLPTALRRAVAVAGSVLSQPTAGRIDPPEAARLGPDVILEEIPCP